MINIFVYGTLMNRDVRASVIGRTATTYSNVLKGYRKAGLNIVEDAESEVQGVTFEVNKDELAMLDRYESVASGLYKRTKVKLEEDEEAWVYTKCDPDQVVFVGNSIG